MGERERNKWRERDKYGGRREGKMERDIEGERGGSERESGKEGEKDRVWIEGVL